MKLRNADKLVERKYGLDHYTQSDPDRWWQNDVWIENQDKGFFIDCSEKQEENDQIQLCIHIFHHDKKMFRVSYNKNYLPDWKLIQSNILGMYKSFKNKKTAIRYFEEIQKKLTDEEILDEPVY